MPRSEQKALFLEYLKKADELRAEPKWYNTLTSNCTTLILIWFKPLTHISFLKIIG